MKSQLSFNAILFAIIIIIGAGILVFGLNMAGSVNGKGADTEITNFILSLQSMIEEVDNYGIGSVRDFNFILPEKIKKICFNDGSEINKFIDAEFNNINKYYEHNIYLFPGYSFKLEGLSLEETPLCFDVNKEVNIGIVKAEKGVNIKVAEKKIDCTALVYNGNEDKKIDVVFLADNYRKLGDFKKDVDDYINYAFYVIEPFKSNKEKINFYMVNEFKNLACKNVNSNIICDSSAAKRQALKCPDDYIIVLSKNKVYSSLRSTVYDGIISLNTADNRFVVMHEIGHLFGDLADEYIVQGLKTVDAPNCNFKPYSNGDFIGCSLEEFYRPTQDSIMKSYGFLKDNTFGYFNENVLKEKIGVYK